MAVLSRAVKKLAHSGRARDRINRQAHFQQDGCEASAELCLPYPAGHAGLAIFQRDLESAGQIPQPNDSRAARILAQLCSGAAGSKKAALRLAKDRDDVFDFHDEEPIIALEIDRNCPFGIEEDLVVLAQGDVLIVLDLGRDSHNSPCYGGDLYIIRQLDAALGLLFVLVLPNQDAITYRLDYFERLGLDLFLFSHFTSILAV